MLSMFVIEILGSVNSTLTSFTFSIQTIFQLSIHTLLSIALSTSRFSVPNKESVHVLKLFNTYSVSNVHNLVGKIKKAADFSNTPRTTPSQQDQDSVSCVLDFWENVRNHALRPREIQQQDRDDDGSERRSNGRRRHNQGDRLQFYDIERLLLQFISPLQTEMPNAGMLNVFPLHTNPRDYAWGTGGLDSVISKLMNQIDGTGIPPAEKDKIHALALTEIKKEQVDKNLQCPPCLNEFELSEQVKELGCNHQYHINCIDQWLLRHGNCPVCRKYLNGRGTTAKH
eukprot:XP_014773544.1 PREDICTED: E3 ubiquitin-protein ligase RNF126-B-like [Octopus bimaculoides]